MVASRRYALVMLTGYFALIHLDRQVISIVLTPIAHTFHLDDLQLGLLSGLAYAMFFSVLGLPIALFAARVNRRDLIAGSIALWSVMTLLTGIAQSYWQILLARFGVGIGEAGALPMSQAILSDRYGPHERATAMGVFMSGANIGTALAFLFGGIAAQFLGWRAAVLLAGAPGLIVAAVIRLTVPEPIREILPDEPPAPPPGLALLRQTIGHLWRDVPMRLMSIATALNAVTTFGVVIWLPTYLIRQFGMSLSGAGLYLSLVIGIGGAIGTMLSGRLADQFSAHLPSWVAWMPALLLLVAKPFLIMGLLSPIREPALIFLALPCMLGGAYFAPTFALLHGGVKVAERPVASALLVFAVNLAGMGRGSGRSLSALSPISGGRAAKGWRPG